MKHLIVLKTPLNTWLRLNTKPPFEVVGTGIMVIAVLQLRNSLGNTQSFARGHTRSFNKQA